VVANGDIEVLIQIVDIKEINFADRVEKLAEIK
jgi:hypothetical protein